MTDLSTFPAMSKVIMLIAFSSAGITNIRTNLTDRICMFTFQTHELCCCSANGRTFHVQLNTFC